MAGPDVSAAGPVVAYRDGHGDLHVLYQVTDPNDASQSVIYERNQPGNWPGPPTTVGTNPGRNELAPVLLDNGTPVLFMWSGSSNVYSMTQKPGPDWYASKVHNHQAPYVIGPAVGNIAAAKNQDGRIEWFNMNPSNYVFHRWANAADEDPGTWLYDVGSTTNGGATPFDVGLGRNPDGRLELFIVNVHGNCWHTWQNPAAGGGWDTWQQIASNLSGPPVVVANANGGLELFAPGASNYIMHCRQTTPGGQAWTPLESTNGGGAPQTKPAVGINANGCLDVFIVNVHGNCWHSVQNAPGGGWEPWEELGAGMSGPPAVISNADGSLEVFAAVAGPNGPGGLMHAWQAGPNGSWNPFQVIEP